MASVGTLGRLSARDLSKELLALDPSIPGSLEKIAIIDVRDDDHVGGHIIHSTHVPSSTLDHAIPSLVRKLADKEIVVFHCALSQVRGPKAALRYLRERDRLLGPSGYSVVGEALMKSAGENKKSDSKGGESKEEGWEDVDDEQGKAKAKGSKEQKIYVLDRGFVGWAEEYGTDKRLTQNFVPDIWENY